MKHCKPYCFYCYLVWYLLSHCIYSLGYNASKHWRRSDFVPTPISLYLERDEGHGWFSCLKLLNTDHLPGFDMHHNRLPNSLLSEQQLKGPFCSGSFWKRVVCSFLWDLKYFSSDHGGAPAQTMCTVPDQCCRYFWWTWLLPHPWCL